MLRRYQPPHPCFSFFFIFFFLLHSKDNPPLKPVDALCGSKSFSMQSIPVHFLPPAYIYLSDIKQCNWSFFFNCRRVDMWDDAGLCVQYSARTDTTNKGWQSCLFEYDPVPAGKETTRRLFHESFLKMRLAFFFPRLNGTSIETTILSFHIIPTKKYWSVISRKAPI